jgi:adenosylcobinamide-phosphate synthase
MSIAATLWVLVGSLGIEAVFRYPRWLYERIGHPVSWIGTLIGFLDHRLNNEGETGIRRRIAGTLALIVVLAVTIAAAWLIERILAEHWSGLCVLALLASTLIASRSLYDHVRNVAQALDADGLSAARHAVGRIVGRDPQALDEAGVARAAIESLAENASDGVVAPAFWFAVLGLPGLAAYKAINTADSMIGHKTPRYEAFGWAAAKLDDFVNLPASRLTGLLLGAAALVTPSASARRALEAMRRDAPMHRSPNAGWPESAMAGALGLKLNGPKTYGGRLVDDAYMGDGRREVTAKDVGAASMLGAVAWALMMVLLLALAVISRM